MTATSELGYLVTMDAATQLAANEPCDIIASATLLNNVNHLQDEFAQVRVNWGDAGYAPPNTGGWQQMMSFEFPISLRQSGTAYKFRIRLGGYATSGISNFRAIISAPNAAGPGLHGSSNFGDSDFITSNAAVGTPGWIAGTSQGGAASPTLIQLPATFTGAIPQNALDGVGGNIVPISVPAARLTVYGKSTKPISDPPLLCGVYLAEYVG